MRNTYKTNIVGIQQQSMENDGQDAYKSGKLEPSVSALKDYKATGADIDMFITLYAPIRNKINFYEGYEITKLRDHYRRFSIQFDRNGMAIDSDLFFDGCCNFFEQMPLPEEKDEIAKIYKRIQDFKS